MNVSKLKGLFLAMGLTLVATLVIYLDVWRDPNGTLMGGGNDALKNYYTPWYHAQWDEGYTWFGGMNYPYGDHVVFADAQPLLSNGLKVLGLGGWTVGVINLGMLLGLVAAAGLLQRILRRWILSETWAGCAAVAIALLSPQALKFTGHFALAYAWAVPLVWLLALRAYERRTWLRSGTVALMVFLMGWLHPYYVMISIVFLTAFGLMHALLTWRAEPAWRRLLHYGIQAVVPILAFGLLLKLTDPVTDRPSDPFGLDQYMSNWRTLFLPVGVYQLDALARAIIGDRVLDWEGIGYVGLIGTMAFVLYWARTSAVIGGQILRRRKGPWAWLPWQAEGEETPKLLVVSMLAGVAVGLFACGFPFAYYPDLTTQIFPPIKQFRTLGRFSWVFFYTWTAFTAVLAWRLHQRISLRNRAFAYVTASLLLGWALTETAFLHIGVAKRVAEFNPHKGVPNLVLGSPAPTFADRLADHDAFIALPYFHIGSENFYDEDPTNARSAYQLSLLSGKPMLNVMMSRTSLAQTWSLLQLVTEPCKPLELLQNHPHLRLLAVRSNDLPPQGPLVQPPGNPETIGGFQVYPIDLTAAYVSKFLGAVPGPRVTHPTNGVLLAASPGESVIWQDMEDGDAEGYRGRGRTVSLKDNNWIYDGTVPFKAGDSVIVSLWARIRGDRLPHALLGWEESAGSTNIAWKYDDFNRHIRRMDGEWALIERTEAIHDPGNRFQVNVTRWKRKPPTIVIDNLLIRRKGADVYLPSPDGLQMQNNRYATFAPPPADSAAQE